jgi:hypothetical protein
MVDSGPADSSFWLASVFPTTRAHFIMQGIDQATSAIRRSMTQKYRMEF